MSYAQEILDGHREMIAEFGTTVTNVDGTALNPPMPVVPVFPEEGLDALLAGTRQTGTFNFNVEATLATAAGLKQESIIYRAGSALRYHVTGAEPEMGSPLLYVSAAVMG